MGRSAICEDTFVLCDPEKLGGLAPGKGYLLYAIACTPQHVSDPIVPFDQSPILNLIKADFVLLELLEVRVSVTYSINAYCITIYIAPFNCILTACAYAYAHLHPMGMAMGIGMGRAMRIAMSIAMGIAMGIGLGIGLGIDIG